jgi:hypothetical protein
MNVDVVNKICIVIMFLSCLAVKKRIGALERCPGVQTRIWKNEFYEQQMCCGGAAAEKH